jgi:dihydroxyacetone kinase-like protein
MGLNRSDLLGAVLRLQEEIPVHFDTLNAADGKLGDGDLGITMTRGIAEIRAVMDDMPDDLGLAMLKCSQAFTKSSGSSYGTLMAIGMMAIAKQIKGQTALEPLELSALVMVARDQIQSRGKAEFGGKTVLDSLDAIYNRTSGLTDLEDIRTAAILAVDEALTEFRDKPATMGRARMFGEKSIGLDDPGMLAMKFIVYAIARQDV